MNFSSPSLLPLSLLALVPLALYLFKRKARTVPVSTLLFFKHLAREHQEAHWLRRLKRILSLLLTLIILFAGVFALARPTFTASEGSANSVIVLLDRSASMGSKDESGKTRMEEAKKLVRSKLDSLPESVPVTLVAYDERPEVLQPATKNHRLVRRALDGVKVRPLADKPDAARQTAEKLAALNPPTQIWQVTDQPTAAKDGVTLFSVALTKAVNVGISSFQVRPVPLTPGKFEAFVQLTASDSAGGTLTVTLEVRVGGNLMQVRELDLSPGKSRSLLLPLEGAEGQIVEVEAKTPGDCLEADNIALAKLPTAHPLQVVWVTEKADPFTQLALHSLAQEGVVQIWQAKPQDWPPKEKADVLVLDNWLPKDWPEDVPGVIVINPPGSVGPVRAVPLKTPVPYESVRSTNEDHPVLFRVSSSRVGVTQTCVMAAGSLEPLWFAGTEPVLAAGEAQGQRLVVLGFAPMLSEGLPLSASYPLLLGNALLWAAEQGTHASNAEEQWVRHTGSIIPVNGNTLHWLEWRGGKLIENDQALEQPVALLDRTGLWRDEADQWGASLLLSQHESTLARTESAPLASGQEEPARANGFRPAWTGGELVAALIWLIVGVLLLESWLFHRKAVY